jgi:hypothetical protein
MISALNSIIVCGFFGKVFSLRNPKESNHMGLNRGYLGASSVHMRNNQVLGLTEMTRESEVSCRKSKTTVAVCGLAPSCLNH